MSPNDDVTQLTVSCWRCNCRQPNCWGSKCWQSNFRKCAIKHLSMAILYEMSPNDDVTQLTVNYWPSNCWGSKCWQIQLLTIFRKCAIKHLLREINIENCLITHSQKIVNSWTVNSVTSSLYDISLRIDFTILSWNVEKNWRSDIILWRIDFMISSWNVERKNTSPC